MNHNTAADRTPLVTVVMPAYNAARYIEEAILSVQMQTIADWELVVIDDCSSDDTCKIIETMAAEDSRIRFFKNEHNCGVAKARNRALDLATGSYVAFLDSDDIWYPKKLEKQLELARQQKADIVYCSYAIINEDGDKQCNDFIVPEQTDLENMLVKSVLSCSTALLTQETAKAYRFPLGYYHEDYALWLWLMKDGKRAYGNTEVLAAYRMHSNSRASNKLLSAKRRWVIYRNYLKLPFWDSLGYFIKFAVLGVKKYRKFR